MIVMVLFSLFLSKIKYNEPGRSSTFYRPDREGEKLRTPAEPESGSRLTWMTEENFSCQLAAFKNE